jgi:hypothetical protein
MFRYRNFVIHLAVWTGFVFFPSYVVGQTFQCTPKSRKFLPLQVNQYVPLFEIPKITRISYTRPAYLIYIFRVC